MGSREPPCECPAGWQTPSHTQEPKTARTYDGPPELVKWVGGNVSDLLAGYVGSIGTVQYYRGQMNEGTVTGSRSEGLEGVPASGGVGSPRHYAYSLRRYGVVGSMGFGVIWCDLVGRGGNEGGGWTTELSKDGQWRERHWMGGRNGGD